MEKDFKPRSTTPLPEGEGGTRASASASFDALLSSLAAEHRRALQEKSALAAKLAELSASAAKLAEPAPRASAEGGGSLAASLGPVKLLVSPAPPAQAPSTMPVAAPLSAAAPSEPAAPDSAGGGAKAEERAPATMEIVAPSTPSEAAPSCARAGGRPSSDGPTPSATAVAGELSPQQRPSLRPAASQEFEPVTGTRNGSFRRESRSLTTPASMPRRDSLISTSSSRYNRLMEAGLVKSALVGAGMHVTFQDATIEELAAPAGGAAGVAEEDEEEQIEMLPMWKMRRKSRCGTRRASTQIDRAVARTSHGSSTKGDRDEGEPKEPLCRHLCARLVLSPDCPRRLAWDALGLLLIGYDCIMIPIQVFDLPSNPFSASVAWLATGFWTADVPGSFLVGFHSDGVLEMRLEKIAWQYARTWLFVDISLVAVDWVAALMNVLGEGDQASEAGTRVLRVGKLVKFLRILRLMRLFKAHGVLNAFIERIQSEWCLIMIGILKLLLFIMLTNHAIACAWYGMSSWREGEGESSWVGASLLDKQDFWYCYLTSLHWSLTQFTPASMEVVPRNIAERLFAVCIITLAMVTFSSFVSAITNAMTRLRGLNHERNEQFSSLRRYFGENRVSTSLTGRIWGCLQKAMVKSKRRVHADDVAILRLLPWTLKTELQEEVYTPILAAHPLFHTYGGEFKMQMRKIYQSAVEEVSLGVGMELFNSGQTADRMFFVISGTMSYRYEDRSCLGQDLVCFAQAKQWLCEAVLWTYWRHSGQLIATTHCELLALRAARLQEVLAQDEPVKRYAKLFVRYFKRNPDMLTDTWADVELLQEMVSRSFFDEDEDVEIAVTFCKGPRSEGSASMAVVPEDGHASAFALSDGPRGDARVSFASSGSQHLPNQKSRLEQRTSQTNIRPNLFFRRPSVLASGQAALRQSRTLDFGDLGKASHLDGGDSSTSDSSTSDSSSSSESSDAPAGNEVKAQPAASCSSPQGPLGFNCSSGGAAPAAARRSSHASRGSHDSARSGAQALAPPGQSGPRGSGSGSRSTSRSGSHRGSSRSGSQSAAPPAQLTAESRHGRGGHGSKGSRGSAKDAALAFVEGVRMATVGRAASPATPRQQAWR